MMGNVAVGSLIITIITMVIAITMAIKGWKEKNNAILESSRLAALCSFPLLSLSMGILLFLLLAGRFEYAYVYETTEVTLPVYLKIAALSGGQAGSLILW